MSLIKALLGPLANRIVGIGAAAVSAALLAYLQTQSSDGIKWLFDPIVRLLPWRHGVRSHLTPSYGLSSELTIAELFLLTPDGKHAIYAKTSNYVVESGPLSSYYEGVTASDKVTGFPTELGAIVRTTIEHGFYVSHVDIGSPLEVGARFRNVYCAQLDGCFPNQEEHWTQEIAVPTKHLTLRVHFPPGRPPTMVRCKRMFGLAEFQIKTWASISRLFGQPAIVWEIKRPKLGDIYKLEWQW